MSVLGEEIVQEWLNRKGYFTIRGIKAGNSQLDILAIKPLPEGKRECRHVECQLSIKSIGYISTGNAKHLDDAELTEEVLKWIEKEFVRQEDLLQRLCPEKWTKELVVGNIKHEDEIKALEQNGITVTRLSHILSDMDKNTVIQSAAGADLFDLTRIQPCWQS
jgi:hypothetical protein